MRGHVIYRVISAGWKVIRVVLIDVMNRYW